MLADDVGSLASDLRAAVSASLGVAASSSDVALTSVQTIHVDPFNGTVIGSTPPLLLNASTPANAGVAGGNTSILWGPLVSARRLRASANDPVCADLRATTSYNATKTQVGLMVDITQFLAASDGATIVDALNRVFASFSNGNVTVQAWTSWATSWSNCTGAPPALDSLVDVVDAPRLVVAPGSPTAAPAASAATPSLHPGSVAALVTALVFGLAACCCCCCWAAGAAARRKQRGDMCLQCKERHGRDVRIAHCPQHIHNTDQRGAVAAGAAARLAAKVAPARQRTVGPAAA